MPDLISQQHPRNPEDNESQDTRTLLIGLKYNLLASDDFVVVVGCMATVACCSGATCAIEDNETSLFRDFMKLFDCASQIRA